MSVTASIAEHVVRTALAGRSLAAADTLLVSDAWAAHLSDTTSAVVRGVVTAFGTADPAGRGDLYHALIRLGLNLVGAEALTLKAEPATLASAVTAVAAGLTETEKADPAVAGRVLDGILAEMRSVNAGDSLPAQFAEELAPALADPANAGRRGAAFVAGFGRLADACIYSVMARTKAAKFGNDYARGLEYLRHVGYVQVSTNPVLAAKAFDEDAALVAQFAKEAAGRPEWKTDPKRHGDAMALRATLIALWPNLTVFRPLALRAGNMDYMVSFQLNPNIADRAAESLTDARSAFQQAAAFLADYDKSLSVTAPGATPPCIVFKVAGAHAACRTITRELNADGVGTNNTVVYSVAQEVRLILDALEGKARALRAGKPVTRTYETNMGGRFTSHLREVEAERVVAAAEAKSGRERTKALLGALADAVKVDAATKTAVQMKSLADQAAAVCSFKFLKSLDQPAFVAVAEAAGITAESVRTLEADLRKAGTLVARRVWKTFFHAANRPKWVAWMAKSWNLTEARADLALGSMDVLPASKRIVEDTLDALGFPNMCHTEFPNHSRAVELAARKPGFSLDTHRDSLSAEYAPEVTARLGALPEFVKGYELTAALRDLLVKEVGIAEAAGWGERGVGEEAWPAFGPVVKTGAEFRAAYDKFVERCIAIAAGA